MTFEQLVKKAQHKLWYEGEDQGAVMHEILTQYDLFDDGVDFWPLAPQDAYFAVKAAVMLNRYNGRLDVYTESLLKHSS